MVAFSSRAQGNTGAYLRWIDLFEVEKMEIYVTMEDAKDDGGSGDDKDHSNLLQLATISNWNGM